MKNLLVASLLSLGSVTLLANCGGSGSDTLTGDLGSVTRNAQLDSADDAARALAALALSQNAGGPEAAFAALGEDEACNQGGDTNGSSVSGNTVTVVYNNCQTTITDGTETTDSVLDGQLRATCNDGIASCNNISATLGNGATPLLADVQVQENGTTTVNAVTRIRGNLDILTTETANSERTVTTSNLVANVDDQQSNQSYTLRSEQLSVDIIEDTSTGAATTSVDGALSVVGFRNCLDGGVDVSTVAPVLENSDGDTSSGELQFNNNNGQTANAEFLSNGTVRITANGSSQTYTDSQLEAFCD